MICIYHSKDLDGYCSGAIVKRKFQEAKLIGFDYGQILPMDDIPEGEPIIMIDVSLPMVEMGNLSKHSGYNMTWIDHHISAISDYKNHDHMGITAILENGVSACEGGWKYLFPDEQMPTAVKLLGEYDTWRNEDKFRWDNAIMPFQYGMRMITSSAETFPQELLNDGNYGVMETDKPVYNIINVGKNILAYQKTQNERVCKCAFEYDFKGLRAICLNNGGANSQVFESVYDESKHDIMVPFVWTGKHWTFSMYTTKDEVDCSVIAKAMGGGGHKKAAGFQVQDISTIFNLTTLY